MKMPRERTDSVLVGWLWVIATLATVVFVLLGSWYPFEWIPGRLETAWEEWLASTSATPSKSDFAINLMLGVPLGFFGLLAFLHPNNAVDADSKRSGGRPVISGVLVLTSVILCGLIAELGQHWFGRRVPSAYDTLAQGLGGFLGIACACIGGRWFSFRISGLIGGYGEAPFWALLDLYVACYVAWMLMPFVPCVSPSELKDKWKSGMIQLSLFAEWREDVWQALYTAIVTSVSALPIGIGFARFLPGNGKWALIGSVTFVVGLEVLQVVIETRSAQASDALWATVGAMTGVFSYYFWSRTDVARREATRERYWLLWDVIAVVGVIGYLSVALAPFEWIESKTELVERVRLLRTEIGEGMLAGNDMMNASNLLRTLFMSIVLGALFGCTSLLGRTHRYWVAMTAIAALLTGVCAASELLQTFSARHGPSMLAAVVRVVGGWLGLVMSASINWRARQAL